MKKRVRLDVEIDTTPGREDMSATLPIWCKSLHYDKATRSIVMTVGPHVPESLDTVDLAMSLTDAERLAAAIEFCRQAAVADTGHQARAAMRATSHRPRAHRRRR